MTPRSEYLSIRHDLPEDAGTVSIAFVLGIEEDSVCGKLIRVWRWAVKNTKDGKVDVNAAFIDKLANIAGFGNAMAKVGWLIIESDSVTFPQFQKHLGKRAKSPAKTKIKPTENSGKEFLASLSKSLGQIIPPNLNNQTCIEILCEWIDYKSEKGQTYKPIGFRNMLAEFKDWTPERFIAAVRLSMRRQWQGIYEGFQNGNGNGHNAQYSTQPPSDPLAFSRAEGARIVAQDAEWRAKYGRK